MAENSRGLGKGFDSLIPTDFDSSLLIDSSDRVQKLFTSDIEPNPEQPRRHFEQSALEELAASIKRFGILQPLIVSPDKDKYILVAGERRWRAAQIAGLTQLPAIVRKREELEQLEVALIENVQRVDLSPLEQAISIEKLHTQFNISYSEIAKRLSKAVPTVNNIVRLLQLPAEATQALQSNQITEGHARAILSLKDAPSKQAELLNLIISKNWSVRQAEQFVVSLRSGAKSSSDAEKRVASATPDTQRLTRLLKAPVVIKRTARGGRLELHFKSDQDLARLIELLGKLSA